MDTIEMRKRAEQALKSSGPISERRQIAADVLALCDALEAEERTAGQLLGQDVQALAVVGRAEAEAGTAAAKIAQDWIVVMHHALGCQRCARVEENVLWFSDEWPIDEWLDTSREVIEKFRAAHAACPALVDLPLVATLTLKGDELDIRCEGGAVDRYNYGDWYTASMEAQHVDGYSASNLRGPSGRWSVRETHGALGRLRRPRECLEAARKALEERGYTVTVVIDDAREKALAKLIPEERRTLGIER